ncbi:MAG TPA: hypothetical protein VNU70_06530 [Puia sp.]|nr:hypothetical protein [Puia sp.]
MKKSFLLVLIVSGVVLAVGCSKNSSGPNPGYGPNSLFPLTNGDTWYYNDSAFNDTTLLAAYADTMVATKAAYTDATGMVYLEMNNPNGWFNGSYIAVDQNNYAVYEVDSPSFSPYTFFATVNQDGQIAAPYTDVSNPACPITYVQYGYANPVSVYGYSCYKNAEVVTDCHGVVLEETNSYLSQGVGVVRIEDFLTDTTGGKNLFYEDYSQTLTSKSLH